MKAVILKVAGPVLSEVGFSYDGQPDRNSWRFARPVGDAEEYVIFVKSNHTPMALRVDLATTLDPYGVELRHLFGVQHDDIWWVYQDETSLRAILKQLVHLTLEHGLPWLDKFGGPYLKPPAPLGRQLLEDPVRFAQSFAERYRLKMDEPESIAVIDQVLMETTTGTEPGDWGPLVEAAGYLGEVVRRTVGGEWTWDDLTHSPGIATRGASHTVIASPLAQVAVFWSKPSRLTSLVTGYQSAKHLSGQAI